MIVEKSIGRFICFGEDALLVALQKISANKSGFVVTVSEQGHLLGILTDGDVRRWLTQVDEIDINISVARIANTKPLSLSVNTPADQIAKQLNDKVRSIPLLDEYGRVVALAMAGKAEFAIGKRLVGAGHPAYIIAEIGNNHNGDINLGKQLIDLAAQAGADCAKFQMRDLANLYRGGGRADDPSQDLGAQYTLDLLARFNLPVDDMLRLFDHCRLRGLEPMCTPWDEPSLEILDRYGMASFKVASADLTNHDLLRAMSATNKPLICSTGMANEAEILETVKLLRSAGGQFALLHCNSTYPAPYKDVNLRYIKRLAELGNCPVGYSGHERGWFVPVAAIAFGASLIEKHFTIDRSMEGNDHKVSLLPDELATMVAVIRDTEESLGAGDERSMTQGEMMNREVLAKSLFAAVDIPAGTVVSDKMIIVQSPGQGLQPNRRGELVGRRIARSVTAGTPFFPSDVSGKIATARPFSFDRPWGIPVRWHDYRSMLPLSNFDLLEYHLSYRDMDVDLDEWFKDVLDIDFVVHAPELFKGDHILDLASGDENYRKRSIEELQRVVEITRDLKKWHGRSTVPPIIVNMGGFTTSRPLPVSDRSELYERMIASLSQIDRDGVEIIPQTMPPFPWHFGGQSYHNLFMDPDEIVAFCRDQKMRVCFDVSHSQLACNHNGWSMLEFCEKVGPYTAHLHIVDAKGVDGEGLQIGEGNMDFGAVASVLDRVCPRASFVPEIWQGHKDSGAGFWYALDKLENWFGQPLQREKVARAK